MNWIKKNLYTIVLVSILVIGLCLLLYPTVSDYWNSLHQTRMITAYSESVAQIDNSRYVQMLEEAREYNRELAAREQNWQPAEEELEIYEQTMNVDNSGMICFIRIPKIGCNLPVYHGTDPAVLQIAVGHIPGSSLPIGGNNTHSVLSGHRGLPSARLLTDLDQLVVGDTFLLNVLDEVLTYEVDQILIVEPNDFSALGIEPGRDLCTLVTCTPYGINSHRLLVRGHRIETAAEAKEIRVSADAIQVDPIVVAPAVAAPILLALLIVLLVTTGRSRKSKSHHNREEE